VRLGGALGRVSCDGPRGRREGRGPFPADLHNNNIIISIYRFSSPSCVYGSSWSSGVSSNLGIIIIVL